VKFYREFQNSRGVTSNLFWGPELYCYKAVRDSKEELIHELRKHRNNQEHFLRVRGWDRREDYSSRSEIEKAARFIFLNKTCFNGLYRVNSKGQFNVPFGHYIKPEIYSTTHLNHISSLLNGLDSEGRKLAPKVKLKSGDYREVTSMARKGDFIYLDPPYDPLTSTASFVGYQKEGFTREHQLELRDELLRLNKLGIQFLLSNSDTPFIRKIYKESKLFQIEGIQVRRAIGASSASRGYVGEVLIYNF
jgi:DNA adenine methylase